MRQMSRSLKRFCPEATRQPKNDEYMWSGYSRLHADKGKTMSDNQVHERSRTDLKHLSVVCDDYDRR